MSEALNDDARAKVGGLWDPNQPRRVVRITNGLGGSHGVVGNRHGVEYPPGTTNGLSSGSLGGFSWVVHRMSLEVGPVDITDVEWDWPNWFANPTEADGLNPIQVSCYLTDANGVSWQVLWQGASQVVIAPSLTVRNDPMPNLLVANTTFFLTIFVCATTANGVYPCNFGESAVLPGEGFFSNGTDITKAPAALSAASPLAVGTLQEYAGFPVYAPVAMRGTVAVAPPRLLLLTDSIGYGYGDTTATRYAGWIKRSLGASIGQLCLTSSGDSMTSLAAGFLRRFRLLANASLTHCILQLGTNDLPGPTPLFTMQSRFAALAEMLAARGISVVASTLLPRTTSTNGFVDTTNQATEVIEPVRVAYNNWLRAGAGGLAAFVLDPASLAETSNNSGIWKATGGAWTIDGLHPSSIGAAAIAPALDPAAFFL